MLTVAELMTRDPYTLGPDDTLEDARKLMAEHNFRHIPIVGADGQLAGIVSQRDVLAASDSSVLAGEPGSDPKENYVALSSIMSDGAQTIDERAALRGAAMHLQQNKLGCLPVMSEGKLVGIITDSDFVAIAINLMEQLEATEPEESDFIDDDF